MRSRTLPPPKIIYVRLKRRKRHSAFIYSMCIAFFLGVSSPTVLPYVYYSLHQPPVQTLATRHFFGGYSIDTLDRVSDAAKDGIQLNMLYGPPPLPGSDLEQALQQHGMQEIDGYISSLLYYYECQGHANTGFCPQQYYPAMTKQAFLNDIRRHLQDVEQHYPLVQGYMLIDDKPSWNQTFARALLPQIHAMLQRYAPHHPGICAFGANLRPNGTGTYAGSGLGDFSPQGCDMVELYVYASSQPSRVPLPTVNQYDWSMKSLLPKMLAVLRSLGWQPKKEPLIGLVQTWGGYRHDVGDTAYEVIPTANAVAQQSLSFCKAGATSIMFYGWDDANVSHFPWNTPQLAKGVQQGIQVCKQWWATH